MEIVIVRFWSSVQAHDCEMLEVEFEFPACVIEKLDNGEYSSFQLTLNQRDTYVFHKIDLDGDVPIIDVVPRLN